MSLGTRINPKTGMKETYTKPAPVDLEKSRKELRDVIHGNHQWHDDPFAAPVVKPEDPDEIDYSEFIPGY